SLDCPLAALTGGGTSVVNAAPSCNMNSMPPRPLIHTSSRVLEFESLRDLIQGYASSPLGRKRIADLSPSIDPDWIENQHQLTSEIRESRRVGGRFEFAALMDISRFVEESRISGAVLETTEIRDVVLVIDRAA